MRQLVHQFINVPLAGSAFLLVVLLLVVPAASAQTRVFDVLDAGGGIHSSTSFRLHDSVGLLSYGWPFSRNVVATSPGFTIALSPAQLTLAPGRTADVTLTVVPTGGFVENVALSFSVLGEDQKPADPALVTVGDFKSTCVAGASFTFKVTAAAASSVTEKTLRYLSVKGTSGSIGGSRNLQIVLDPSSSSVVLLGADQQEGLEELRPAVGDSVKISGRVMPSPGVTGWTFSVVVTASGVDKSKLVKGKSAATTDGRFSFTVGPLDQAGSWTVTVEWSGTNNLPGSRSKAEEFTVTQDPGVAVIVAGMDREGDPATPYILSAADRAREALLKVGYTDASIYYIRPGGTGAGVDSDLSLKAIQTAIQTWARGKSSALKPLLIYLADHGWAAGGAGYEQGAMRCGSDNLRGSDLALWLAGYAPDVPITIVYDACYASTFAVDAAHDVVDAARQTILVAASSHKRVTYTHPAGPGFGLVFSQPFFDAVVDRKTVFEAFSSATNSVWYSLPWKERQYKTSWAFPYPKLWGAPSVGEQESVAKRGERLARTRTIGGGVSELELENTPRFFTIAGGSDGDLTSASGARITVVATATPGIGQMWATLIPPDFNPPAGTDVFSDTTLGFQKFPLKETKPGRYSGEVTGITLPGEWWVLLSGMDNSGNTARPELPQPGADMPNNVTMVTVRQTARPEAALSGVTMMTVPLADVGATDLAEILGIPHGNLRAATYNPEYGDYVIYPNFALPSDSEGSSDPVGLGMWVRFPEAWQKSIIGSPMFAADPFTVELRQGWNLIGNPYLAPLSWSPSGITVNDGTATRTLEADAATGNPAVEDYAWTWNSREGAYRLVYDLALASSVSDTVPVWSAFWVKANRDCRLTFGQAAAKAAEADSQPGRVQWAAAVDVAGTSGAQSVVIGVAGESLMRGLDIPTPPAPPMTRPFDVEIIPSGAPEGAAPALACQLAAAGSRAVRWTVAVRSNQPGQELSLSIPDLRQLPRDMELYVTDTATGQRRYMRTSPAVTFTTGDGVDEVRTFTIEALPQDSTSLRISAVSTDMRRADGCEVRFALSRAARVEVRVLNAAGRVVATLAAIDGVAGENLVRWNGRSDSGSAVPAGTYRLVIRGVTEEGEVSSATAQVIW